MNDLMYNVEVNGKQYTLTGEGQLTDMSSWDKDILGWLADKADIELKEEHHTALKYIRDNYASRERYPVVRLVADHLGQKHGADKGTQRFFYDLFPKGVGQASTLAGIPVKELCF